MRDWFKTKIEVQNYLISLGYKHYLENYYTKNEKAVVIMQDKSKARRGWTFGYL